MIILMWYIMTSHHHVKMVLNEPQITGYLPSIVNISINWYYIHPLVQCEHCLLYHPKLIHYAKIL